MSRNDRPETLNGNPPDALDHAIERTLREMVALDPPDRLTSRVMARIASADVSRARGPFAGWWPLAAGLAAAAVLVLAIAASMWPDRIPPSAPQTASGAPAPVPEPQPVAPRAQPPETARQADAGLTPSTDVRTTRPRQRTAPAETATATLEPAITIAPLAAPDVIVLENIAPPDAPLQPLEIPRMEIAPIDMTSKTPSQGDVR